MVGRILGVVATILFLVAGLVATERFFSPTFKSCVAEQHTQDRTNSAKEHPPGFSSSAGTYIECTGVFIDKNNGSITALATMVIAAFTFTLWRATTRQSDLTREALIADKQPFIFPDAIFSYWEQSLTQPDQYDWRFRPIWQNSSDTAPKNFVYQCNCELRDSLLPPNYAFSSNASIGGGLLGPKMRAPGGLAPPIPSPGISPQDIIDVQQQRKFLYLWGWARYEDGFPRTPRHLTHFCWAITPVGDPFQFVPGAVAPAIGSMAFDHVQTPEGNYTKDEYRHQKRKYWPAHRSFS